jgi:hypothetical protein
VTVSSDIESIGLIGVLFIPFGILVLIFGIVGLILVALGKRGPAIGGLVLGILAFVFALLALVILLAVSSWLEGMVAGTGVSVTVDYGIYLSVIGSIILIVGSAMVMGAAKAEEMAPPMPYAPGPPMEGPPMGAPPMEEPPMEQPPEPPMVE